MTILPLSEGAFTVDRTKSFVPFDKNTDDLQQRPAGSLLVEVQPFAVITQKDIIVLDTGLGFLNGSGMLQIHQNLRDRGVEPRSVTKVLISHLHKDHAGGISCIDPVNGGRVLSFPEATYYVDRDEFEYGLEKGLPSYIPEEFELLNNSGNAVFTTGSDMIDGYISYSVSGAHSPLHRVFSITENGERIFYGGDVAPQLQQMKNRFVAKYDYDGKKAMTLRQQWWEEGLATHSRMLFYHDIKTPFIQL